MSAGGLSCEGLQAPSISSASRWLRRCGFLSSQKMEKSYSAQR